MSTEIIANRQLFFILFMIRTNVVIAFLPVITSHHALQDAWASGVVQFFGAALLLFMIGKLGTLFPDMTVVQYSQKLLGTWVGKGVSLAILWSFLHIAAGDVRLYAEVLVTGFLTETPLVFLIFSMVLVSALAAYGGIEVIGRTADLLFPLYLLMIVISLLLPVPQMTPLLFNLEPVLARGPGPVLGGAVIPVAIIAQYLVITMLIPNVDRPRKALRTSMWALASASVALVLVSLVTVVTLGPHNAARHVFPFFTMIRTIQITEFLERMEALAIFAWGFGLFIGLSIYLYCGARGLSQVMGLKNYRPLVGPMAVIWIVLGIHAYNDIFQMREFFSYRFAPYLTGLIIFPMGLLWLGFLIRKLRGGGTGAP